MWRNGICDVRIIQLSLPTKQASSVSLITAPSYLSLCCRSISSYTTLLPAVQSELQLGIRFLVLSALPTAVFAPFTMIGLPG